MPSVPWRLQQGTKYTDAQSLLNDNFDKITDYLTALCVGTTTTATATMTIATVATGFQSVVIVNPGSTSVYPYATTTGTNKTLVLIQPQISVYVDTDNDATRLIPNGSGLTAGQKNCSISFFVDAIPVEGLGSVTMSIRNIDTISHTYYIKLKCGYLVNNLNT